MKTLAVGRPPAKRCSRGGKPFPVYEDMVIEDLTDDEEAAFLTAIAEA
jgi:hypothetical protein